MGTSRLVTEGGGRFQFEPLAPGDYELLAEDRQGPRAWGAYRKIQIEDRNRGHLRLSVNPFPELSVRYIDAEGNRVQSREVQLFVRRKSLAGKEPRRKLSPYDRQLAPGPWEVAIVPPADLYVKTVRSIDQTVLEQSRGDKWNSIFFHESSGVHLLVELSYAPARLSGIVTDSRGQRAAGAPVFLESVEVDPESALEPMRETRTNRQGEYQFAGLPPGRYRSMSSFDFHSPDKQALDTARAPTVSLGEGDDQVLALKLYVRR